ncbi:hypothetical protein NDU88_011107 [Pleurodeles waltl]|uniref:Murine leukemia virus integrase C-terminal domain-containing protein n=1 Tax=Pleurodeles waltl TaxID=8319 RepID=A0AAV7QZF3_PLEWA|nr:hypothetical protein NDU88_011107 [Pleurodeles waltl]
MNGTLKSRIAKICAATNLKRPDALPLVLLSMRNTPDRKTGLSPHEILMGRAMRLSAVPANALRNIIGNMVLDYCNGLADVVRSFSQQVQPTNLPPIHDPGHNLRAGDWVVVRKDVCKTCLELRWKGPYQVVLTTTTAVKCARLPNWIHVSYTKRVVCPPDHEEALLKAPTTGKQVVVPEPEKEPIELEVEPEPVEDGSITPVGDESEELKEGAEESISTDTAGEPSSAEVLPVVDGAEKQTEQVPDLEGERVDTDQSQGDPTPPEPVAGPSRENTIEKEKEKSPILRRILTDETRKGDNWPESQIGKKKELVINETIEEEVDTTRKEELSERELSGD